MSAVVDSQLWQKMEAAFARFESAWQSGPPLWEDHLDQAKSESLDHSTVVREFVKIDLDYRWKQTIVGTTSPLSILSPRRPSVFDRLPMRPLLESYVECLPELGAVERLGLELIGEEYRVRRRYGDSPRKEEYRARFFAHPSIEIDQTLAQVDRELRGESTESSATKRRKLGRYELIEQIGQGAFGVVWKAWDPHLRREVAIKLPRGAAWTTPEGERRFVREACATAKLSHEGIVSVHDVGREDDAIFLVAELVQGTTLSEWLKEQRPSVNESIELVARLAEALDYAHRHGIVHRDIKPSNVMLDTKRSDSAAADPVLNSPSQLMPPPAAEDSRGPSVRPVSLPFRPRIMDFGLAKRTAGDTTMTRDGHLLGTPAYMSPEQFRDPHKVDGRSDVYSLGVILYELLTGSVPFQGETHTVLAQVQTKPPPAIRKIAGNLPSGAEAIVMKCLAKSPDDRYWTAGELADDLRRLLNSQQTRAEGQTSLGEYFRRMLQLPWAAVVVPLLLLLGCGAGILAAKYFQTPEASVVQAAGEATSSEHPAPNTFAALDPNNIAETNRFDGMPNDLVAVIGQSSQRHWGQAYQVVYIPRSNLVATSSEGGFVHLWRYDEKSHRMGDVDSFWASPGRIRGLATLRDGNWLATGGDDGVVRLWDLDRERRLAFDVLRDAVQDREEAPASVIAIAAAPGVDRLAVATERGATVWDLSEVPAKRIAHVPGEGMVGISFGQSPEEFVIVQGDAASLWKLDSSIATNSARENPWFVHARRVRQEESEEPSEGDSNEAEENNEEKDEDDSSQPGGDHEPEMNDEESHHPDEGSNDQPAPEELPPFGATLVARWENHGDAWRALAVEPTLGLLAVGGNDQGPIVWSLKNPPDAPPVHKLSASGISALGFFPGRSDLVVAGSGGSLEAWNLDGREPRRSHPPKTIHAGQIHGLALDPTGQVVFTVGEDHTVRASNSATGQTLTKIEGHVGPINRVLFLGGNSEQIASWSTAERILRLWKVADGNIAAAISCNSTVDPLRVATAPDGSFFALAEEDAGKTSVILRNRDGNRRYTFPKSFMELLELAVSPDGQRVVAVTAAGEIVDGHIEQKEAITRRNADEQSNYRAAAISPLADAVALLQHDGGMRLQSWRSGHELERDLFSGDEGDLTMAAFSPDGQWIAAAIDSSQLRLWRVEDGTSWKEPYDDSEGIAAMAFSPDSATLVLVLRDGSVRWIDSSRVGSAGSKRGREGPDPVVRFSPDGRHFLVADGYGRLTLWNSSNDRVVRQWEFGGAILDAAFSPDGRHIVTGNANGTAYVLKPSGW